MDGQWYTAFIDLKDYKNGEYRKYKVYTLNTVMILEFLIFCSDV